MTARLLTLAAVALLLAALAAVLVAPRLSDDHAAERAAASAGSPLASPAPGVPRPGDLADRDPDPAAWQGGVEPTPVAPGVLTRVARPKPAPRPEPPPRADGEPGGDGGIESIEIEWGARAR